MNTIIAGTDPYFIDMVCAEIIGMSYTEVTYLKVAEELGLITTGHREALKDLDLADFRRDLLKPDVPLLVKAMVLTSGQLFIAGPPDLLDEKLLNFNQDVPTLQAQAREQADAWQGHRGGLLWALSPTDGKKLAQYHLDAPPIFDGLAVADAKLFVVQQNGVVHCLE